MKLRPDLYVLTGTFHASSPRFAPASPAAEERKRANVITTTGIRQVGRLAVLRTPFGLLYDPERLLELREVISGITKRAIAFNRGAVNCVVWNYIVCEPLGGVRRTAVEGWLARKIKDADAEVAAALPLLDLRVAAA